MLDASRSMLLLIDLQDRLMPAIADGATVTETALRLARFAQRLAVPIAATVQNPTRLGGFPPAFVPFADKPFAKMHFDATAEPGFAEICPDGVTQVVVAGCEAHVCVQQTCLGLRWQGRDVYVVADACGSRRPSDRQAALERLARHGCEIVTSEMVAFEWLRRADTPAFRDLLPLIR